MNTRFPVVVLAGGLSLWIASDAWSYPAYVAPTSASGCTSCHNDNYGYGFKSGILAAFEQGGLAGLKNFLHPVVVNPVDPDPEDEDDSDSDDDTDPIEPVNTKPVIRSINSKWDITVGEAPLVIPIKVYDAETNSFDLHGTAPVGYSFSAVYLDNVTKLPTSDFIWSPSVTQANKSYLLNIYAHETDRDVSSSPVRTIVQVWPARESSTKNISQLQLTGAQLKNGKLNLAGTLSYRSGLTEAQKAVIQATLVMSVKDLMGNTINTPVKILPQANGNWYKTLTLTGKKIPCTIKLEYEGLRVSRSLGFASLNDHCDY
jgi:hypothetical protein